MMWCRSIWRLCPNCAQTHRCQLGNTLAQVGLRHDRVAPVDRLRLVAGQLHGDRPTDGGPLQRPDGGPSQVAFPEQGPEYLMSWSRNTRKVAYWNSYCGGLGLSWLSCSTNQEFLYVLDLASGTSKRVAVHTLAGDFGYPRVAISPTGSTIAYAVNGGLYLLDVK